MSSSSTLYCCNCSEKRFFFSARNTKVRLGFHAFCTKKKNPRPRSLGCSSTRALSSSSTQQQQHSAALEQHSTRAAPARLLLLLLYCCVLLCVLLEQHSSARAPVGFHAYCTENKKPETPITRLLERDEHETNTSTTWPSSYEHTSTQPPQQQQQQHSSALEQHSTRAALLRLLLLLLYPCVLLEQHSSARA